VAAGPRDDSACFLHALAAENAPAVAARIAVALPCADAHRQVAMLGYLRGMDLSREVAIGALERAACAAAERVAALRARMGELEIEARVATVGLAAAVRGRVRGC